MSDRPQPAVNLNFPEALPRPPKSLAVAVLLWLFLGGLGAHRFYLRRRRAVTILILSVIGAVTALAGVGLFLLGVVGVWLLIDLFFLARWIAEYNAHGSVHSPR